MTTLPHETAGFIAEALGETAEWRDLKAAEFPDDERNSKAAGICRRLADEFLAGNYDSDLIARYQNIINASIAAEDDGLHQLSEAEDELKRNIGFHFWPDYPDEYLRSVIMSSRAGEAA